jgi:hypothetical protein
LSSRRRRAQLPQRHRTSTSQGPGRATTGLSTRSVNSAIKWSSGKSARSGSRLPDLAS